MRAHESWRSLVAMRSRAIARSITVSASVATYIYIICKLYIYKLNERARTITVSRPSQTIV